MQILLVASSPWGNDPLLGEGIALSCHVELADSAGEVRLTSADPNVQPHLEYRCLVEPWDRQRMRESIRLCIRLLEHSSFPGDHRGADSSHRRWTWPRTRRWTPTWWKTWAPRHTSLAPARLGPVIGHTGGGRPVLPGARSGEATGGGCIGDARRRPGQYQRDHHYDCRAGRRLDEATSAWRLRDGQSSPAVTIRGEVHEI